MPEEKEEPTMETFMCHDCNEWKRKAAERGLTMSGHAMGLRASNGSDCRGYWLINVGLGWLA